MVSDEPRDDPLLEFAEMIEAGTRGVGRRAKSGAKKAGKTAAKGAKRGAREAGQRTVEGARRAQEFGAERAEEQPHANPLFPGGQNPFVPGMEPPPPPEDAADEPSDEELERMRENLFGPFF